MTFDVAARRSSAKTVTRARLHAPGTCLQTPSHESVYRPQGPVQRPMGSHHICMSASQMYVGFVNRYRLSMAEAVHQRVDPANRPEGANTLNIGAWKHSQRRALPTGRGM